MRFEEASGNRMEIGLLVNFLELENHFCDERPFKWWKTNGGSWKENLHQRASVIKSVSELPISSLSTRASDELAHGVWNTCSMQCPEMLSY